MRVPDEIAVVGFDDIPIARYVTPPLTTMRVDIAELGRRAFALLLDVGRRAGARADGATKIVATTLVVRESCGAAATPTDGTARTDSQRCGRGKGEAS